MKTPIPESDPFLEALRGDLPTERDEARVRARLLAAGLVLTAAATTSTTTAAVATSSASTASVAAGSASVVAGGAAPAAALGVVPAAVVKAGLLSSVVALPVAAKLGLAASLVVAVAASGVPLVRLARDADEGESHAVATRSVPAPVSRTAVLPALNPAPSGPTTTTVPAPGATSSRSAAEGGASTAAAAAPMAAPAAAVAPAAGVSRPTRVGRVAPGPGTPVATPERGVAPGSAPVWRARVTHAPVAAAAQSAEAPARSLPLPPQTTEPASVAITEAAPVAAPAAGSLAATAPAPSSLAEETRLMEHALAALAEGDRDTARRWLGEHAERFPNGLLGPERSRAFERLARSVP